MIYPRVSHCKNLKDKVAVLAKFLPNFAVEDAANMSCLGTGQNKYITTRMFGSYVVRQTRVNAFFSSRVMTLTGKPRNEEIWGRKCSSDPSSTTTTSIGNPAYRAEKLQRVAFSCAGLSK